MSYFADVALVHGDLYRDVPAPSAFRVPDNPCRLGMAFCIGGNAANSAVWKEHPGMTSRGDG